jgi:para-nitrobenzyl esterase
MNDYWVNFVKTGNPNGEGMPEWGVYDKSSGIIMEIGDKPQSQPGLHKGEFDFLEGIFKNAK